MPFRLHDCLKANGGPTNWETSIILCFLLSDTNHFRGKEKHRSEQSSVGQIYFGYTVYFCFVSIVSCCHCTNLRPPISSAHPHFYWAHPHVMSITVIGRKCGSQAGHREITFESYTHKGMCLVKMENIYPLTIIVLDALDEADESSAER
jgi:hypothetical protein